MKIYVIIACLILTNSILGYVLSLLDIRCCNTDFNFLFRPWSVFFGKEVKYNLSVKYVAAMSIFGPLPKVFLNTLFLAVVIILAVFLAVAYVYGFIFLYFGRWFQWLIPIPKRIGIKKEARLTIRKTIMALNSSFRKSEIDPMVAISLSMTTFSVLVLICFFK